MKIFGICLIKNEADIIAYSLNRHSEWADQIFVYDNGSTDGTWEIVLDLAKINPKIIPFKQEAKPFRDGLRSEIFNAYKHLVSDGDWWCIRCDSDEFYLDDPRTFLKTISPLHHLVASIHYEYRLTVEDVESLSFNKPIEAVIDQLTYYHPKQNSEIRFIKHRTRLQWPDITYGYPKHKGVLSAKKIRLKHFQYRTPEQIERRILVRKQATAEGYQFFGRDVVESWKDKLVHRADMVKETPEMPIVFLRDMNKTPLLKRLILLTLHTLKIFP